MNRLPFAFFLLLACCAPADDRSIDEQSSDVVSSSDRVSLRVVREIQDQRRTGDPRLGPMLGPAARRLVTAAAIRAVGQMRDPAYEDAALGFLTHRSLKLRIAAAEAAQWLSSAKSAPALVAAMLAERDLDVKATMAEALHSAGRPEDVAVLGRLVEEGATPRLAQAAALAIGSILLDHGTGAELLTEAAARKLWTTARNEKDGLAAGSAAFALGSALNQASSPWATRPLAEEITADLGRIEDDDARTALTIAISRTNTPAGKTAVVARIADRDHVVRAIALREATDTSEPALAAMANALRDPDPQVVLAAARQLAARGNAALAHYGALETLFRNGSSPALRAQGLQSCVAIAAERARPLVEAAIADAEPWAKAAGLEQLPVYTRSEDVPRLLSLVFDPEPVIANAAFSGLRGYAPKVLPTDDVKKVLRAAALSDRQDLLVQVTLTIEALEYKDLVPSIARTLDHLDPDTRMVPVRNVLGALGRLGGPSELPLIDRYLDHPAPMIAEEARTAHETITGMPITPPPPRPVTEPTPPEFEIEAALRSDILLETTKGTVRIRPSEDAPVAVTKIMRLVKSGAYSGNRISRSDPGSTSVFGDPTMSGYGGFGRSLRSERSPRFHYERHSFAFPAAGWDSEDTQLFFNRRFNLRYGHGYMGFGHAISGGDILDGLELGDRILNARVVPR